MTPSAAGTEPVIEIEVLVAPAPAVDARARRQGGYAGIVSRTVSLCVDAVVLAVMSISTLFVLQAFLAMVRSVPFSAVTIEGEWGVVIVVFQSTAYFTIGWAVFGRTGGEALFGLRLVRRDGRPVGWARALLRFLVLPASFLACGLGYVWIVIDRRRRTWSDLLVGTVVIYDWRKSDLRPEVAVAAAE